MKDELPHIDDALVADLKELMAEDFEFLVRSFVKDSKDRLTGIKEKLTEQDAMEFSRACHSFKGSASNVGAVRLADLCLQGERKGADRDLSRADELLLDMTREFSLVADALHDTLTG